MICNFIFGTYLFVRAVDTSGTLGVWELIPFQWVLLPKMFLSLLYFFIFSQRKQNVNFDTVRKNDMFTLFFTFIDLLWNFHTRWSLSGSEFAHTVQGFYSWFHLILDAKRCAQLALQSKWLIITEITVFVHLYKHNADLCDNSSRPRFTKKNCTDA